MDRHINSNENLARGALNLYLCNNMNKLKDLAEIKVPKLPPDGLLRKLDAIKKNIATSQIKGDREVEYVNIFRFIQIFNHTVIQISKMKTQKTKGMELKVHSFKEFSKIYLDRLSDLQNFLEKSYEVKEESKLNIQNSVPIEPDTHNSSVNKENEVTPAKIEDVPKRSFIKCSELYLLITKMQNEKKKKILVIDVRTAEDFGSSHVNKLEVLNISSEIIQKGKSASLIGKELKKESSQPWRERHMYDMIILMDWRSKEIDLNQNSEIYILKDIMINWDPGTKYKCILILDGGFEELLSQYPQIVTNPKVIPPYDKCKNYNNQDLLNRFDYPMDLLEPPKPVTPKVVIEPKKKTELVEMNVDEDLQPRTEQPKVYPAFSRANKPVTFTNCTDFVNKESSENKKTNESGEGDVLKSTLKDEDQSNEVEVDVCETNGKVEAPSSSEINLKVLIDDLRKVKPSNLNSSASNNKATSEEEPSLPSVIHQQTPESLGNEDSSDDDWSPKKISRKQDGTSSNLKRSLSSPNIAQIKDDELTAKPTFSRSNKPSSSPRPLPTTLMFGERTDATYGKTTLGLTGLKNFANNCYMNSILQCLSNTDELVKELIHLNKPALNPNSKTKGEIANGVITALRCIWSGELRVYSIRDLKTIMGNYQEIFSGANHQDSHEFLIILLEYLHDDLNIPADNVNLIGALDDSGEKAWGEFKRKNCSVIQRLFYGQDRSSVTCSTCSHTSITFGQFFNLFVPIPEHYDRTTLEDCIQLYMRGERISGWHCPKCHSVRNATKKMDITRLPPILIIALKRFSQEGQSSWLEKKENLVTYPLEDLDMSRFTVPGSEQRYSKYNLHALSLHSGTLRAGHYRAICKSRITQKWYIYDDAMITSISPNEVRSNPDVYILFYHAVK